MWVSIGASKNGCGTKLTAMASLLVATGCVYALHRELAPSLPAATLIDDAYLLAAVLEAYRFVVERRAIAYDYPTRLGSGISTDDAHAGGAVSVGGQLSAAAECLYAGGLPFLLTQTGAAAAAVGGRG
jgi:hypothetical protein